jgi:hypothetical protein
MKSIPQVKIAYIEQFPRVPTPFRLRNWANTARSYTEAAFRELATVETLKKPTAGGYLGDIFTIPSYVEREGTKGEALTCLGALVGGGLAGFDLTRFEGRDWTAMADAYYTRVNGCGLVLNNLDAANTCGSFWYDIFPSCLYFHLDSLYPGSPSRREKMLEIAQSWLEALPRLKGNFEHTGFDFAKMEPVDSGFWVEPDAAIGLAYIFYISYLIWKEQRFFDAAVATLTEMGRFPENPYYEILGSYGPCLAARMNAEQKTKLPIHRFLSYVFDDSSGARPGWGIIKERWGAYDAQGLAGSTTDSQGYAFAMNTFVTAGLLAPLVRYAPQYAKSMAKWLLHVAVNSNLFYPDALPAAHQRNWAWSKAKNIADISYEGVRHRGQSVPFATGDHAGFFNPYGAWAVAFLGALFEPTSVPEILKIDLVATEFHAPPAYPTYLLYNPLPVAKKIEISSGEGRVDIYDLVSQRFLREQARGSIEVELKPDQVVVPVLLPSDHPDEVSQGDRARAGIVYAYRVDGQTMPIEIPLPKGHLSRSRPVQVSSAADPRFAGGGAVDANWGTWWQPDPKDPEPWLQVDLGVAAPVTRVKLRWLKDREPRICMLLSSKDGRSWDRLAQIDPVPRGLNVVDLSPAKEASQIKITCEPKSEECQLALVELEVYS